mmetsp:Transcript_36545/g.54583  ORF Transcript_36545/g.54583 Transcript_36545/m.54583 type:complete len:126 (-) Transcript_36545:50-427(-)
MIDSLSSSKPTSSSTNNNQTSKTCNTGHGDKEGDTNETPTSERTNVNMPSPNTNKRATDETEQTLHLAKKKKMAEEVEVPQSVKEANGTQEEGSDQMIMKRSSDWLKKQCLKKLNMLTLWKRHTL